MAGYLGPEHEQYLRDCEGTLIEAGLGAEFHYRGALNRTEKIEFLRKLDVFSVPTTYAEPKGMFLLEAMACGVPLVQPHHGAFPEIMQKTDSGVLVEPNDPESVADGLFKLYSEPELADKLGQNGYENVRRYYGVGNMADRALAAYSSLLG